MSLWNQSKDLAVPRDAESTENKENLRNDAEKLFTKKSPSRIDFLTYLVEVVHFHPVLSLMIEVVRRQMIDCVSTEWTDRLVTWLKAFVNGGHDLQKDACIQRKYPLLVASEENLDKAVVGFA